MQLGFMTPQPMGPISGSRAWQTHGEPRLDDLERFGRLKLARRLIRRLADLGLDVDVRDRAA